MRKVIVALMTILLLVIGVSLILLSPLIGGYQSLKPSLQSLGSFITATIILGFLYRVTIRQYDDEELEKRLDKLIDKKINFMFEGCTHYGLEGFEHEVKFSSIFDSLEREDILWWLDTYDPKHHDWLENLEAALRRGASVNVLVMHPDSPLADNRADELGPQFSRERFHADLKSFRTSLMVVQQNTLHALGKLRIVEYKDLPCAPIYVICNRDVPRRGFSSLFLGKPTAIRFPHLCWGPSEGDFLGAQYQYLVDKWNRNTDNEIHPNRDQSV